MLDRAMQFLFYGFIVLLPWQTVYLLREVSIGGEKWEYGTIGLYVNDIFLVSFLVLTLWKYWREVWRSTIDHKYLAIALSAFTAYVFLGSLWSADPALTVMYALRIAAVILLCFAISSLRVSLLHAICLLTTSCLLHAGIGIWQFVAQSDFASTLLGMSYHDAARGGVSVMRAVRGGGSVRMVDFLIPISLAQ